METRVKPTMDIETRLSLEDLNGDFCYHLDHGNVDALLDLFCEDATYSHGKRVSNTRAEIRELFQRRQAETIRTSRHLQTGLRVKRTGIKTATGESVCLTFAADEPPPIYSASPYLVADFLDEYRCCSDGKWRIAKRHIKRIFTSRENTGPVGEI